MVSGGTMGTAMPRARKAKAAPPKAAARPIWLEVRMGFFLPTTSSSAAPPFLPDFTALTKYTISSTTITARAM